MHVYARVCVRLERAAGGAAAAAAAHKWKNNTHTRTYTTQPASTRRERADVVSAAAHTRTHARTHAPGLDLVAVALQLLDLLFQVALILFLLRGVVGLIDLGGVVGGGGST